ncbi:MAG: hypothetical protein KIS91_15095 [Anaerolineae bacterium]|nr:hypothetical protein [Anaerolineae bacterium]
MTEQTQGDLELVATFPNYIEAQVWADMLAREGIAVKLMPSGPGAGLATVEFEMIQMMTTVDQAAAARDMLIAYNVIPDPDAGAAGAQG